MTAVVQKIDSPVVFDWLGISASFGCGLHCAAMPLLLTALPTLTSVKWIGDPLFHQLVAVGCALLVYRAILSNCRAGKFFWTDAFAYSGLSLLFVAAFVLPDPCCQHPAKLPAYNAVETPQSQFKLVSTGSSDLSLLAKMARQPSEQVDNSPRCSIQPQTLGRSLLTVEELSETLGYENTAWLMKLHRLLTPIGGLLLIFAHVLNLRQRGCQVACGSRDAQ